MVPILIIGGDVSERLLQAQNHYQNNSPQAILDGSNESIKIEDVREFQKMCSLKSKEGSTAYFLITEAQNLTLPSQHALLKTLEESFIENQIVLTCDTESSLLPTILSRCFIIRLKNNLSITPELETTALDVLKRVVTDNPGQLISLAQEVSANDDLLNALKLVLRNNLYKKPSQTRALAIKLINLAETDIKSNINAQFVFENLFFKLKKLL